MAFLKYLQQRLLDLYREFPENLNEVNIQMKPNNLTIITSEQTINIPTDSVKKINYTPYLLDLFNAELDFDFGLYAETDLQKLTQYIENESNPNGKRLLAYSLIETKMNQLIKDETKGEALKQLKKYSQQNTSRLRQIAKRANKLMQEVNEFPIRLTTKVTPRWLYRLTEGELEEFILKYKEMNNLEYHFAGAQI
jgi:hypothetical protein